MCVSFVPVTSLSVKKSSMNQSEGASAHPNAEIVEQTQLDTQPANERFSILDSVFSVDKDPSRGQNQLRGFLVERSDLRALEAWLGRSISLDRDTKEGLANRLNQDVAEIDRLLNSQVNAVIHHPRFQKLEASWRGLKYLHNVLVREYDPAGSEVKIKILDVSWQELERDFESAWDVQQSSLFYKIYEQEFGQAGGEPFGLLIGDYEIKPPDVAGHSHDDFSILSSIAEVAASAFSPFVANASPELFQLSDFGELEEVQDLADVFHGPGAARWQSLCRKEDSRFIGLAMPKVLMRLPYEDRPDSAIAREQQRSGDASHRLNEFCFREDVRGPDTGNNLWGGAAFVLAGVVLRAFCRTGWLTDIRGVQRNDDGGGLVDDLPTEFNRTDSPGVSPKISTDVIITDQTEKELTDLGFIPLCSCYDTGYSAFYSTRSIQIAQEYNDELANLNARVSSMIYTMLCASRFAHYLKKIGRDMVGRHGEADDIEREMQNWITNFVTADMSASTSTKARYPLANANVSVRSVPGKSGVYRSIFHLQPHYEIEGLSAAIRLVTEL